jgi:hypothetical protein
LIYEKWRNERNKRVSHPIGHGEVHEIGIALPPAVDKPDIITLQSQKVSASGKDAKLLMEMAKAIKCNINSELDIAFTELRKEVRALPLKKLQALPDLSIQPARGSKRPLGR